MKYKNISGLELEVSGVGIVKAGEEVETDVEINSANFQKVELEVNETKPLEKPSSDKSKK
jgi:hypothetical protein